jgi:hypothetical protein
MSKRDVEQLAIENNVSSYRYDNEYHFYFFAKEFAINFIASLDASENDTPAEWTSEPYLSGGYWRVDYSTFKETKV